MKNSQLIKRNHIAGGYTKVYPIAYIQGITDGVTGEHLTDILQSFSHIYLPYEGSAKDTRTSLPDDYRRQGIWITYNSGDSIITEIYKGTADDLHNDVLFGEDANWERVPDLKYVQSNASKIPDGAILPEMLSPSILQLLSNGNTIYNVVDDEDLESNECNVIKFKDRVYNKELASGKGYKVLRKNWVNGKNILTQDMIANTNTIYEIRYDFDLDGQEIIIPEGCVLNFQGGSLDNGILLGTNTGIEAGNYKIYGDNLALYKYGFIKVNSGNVNNDIIWLDYKIENGILQTNKVILPESIVTGNYKLMQLSGYEATSNADGQGVIVPIQGEFDVNKNLIVGSPTKLTFSDHTATYGAESLNGYQLGTFYKTDGNFITPAKSHYLFYNSSLEEAIIGTEIVGDVYVSYLNRAVPIVSKSTFKGTAKLSWFIGDAYTTDITKLTEMPDVSAQVNKALKCSCDLESDIHGYIRIEDSLYAETQKKIKLGVYANASGIYAENNKATNRKSHFNWNYTTVFYTVNMNKPMLYIRNADISINGGEFTAKYANKHDKFLCVLDADYFVSNCDLNCKLTGKVLSNGVLTTEGGFYFAVNDRNYGYVTYVKLRGYTNNVKYAVYKGATVGTSAWVTSIDISTSVWGYWEAFHIEGISCLNIQADVQATDCIPLEEVDNYRYSYITGSYAKVDVFFWDVSFSKGTSNVTRPYRLAYASSGVEVYGRATGNNYYQWECSDKNTFKYGKLVPQELNNRFEHYLLNNILINCEGTRFLKVCKKDNFTTFNEPSIEKDGSLKSGVSQVSDLQSYAKYPVTADANRVAPIKIESESYAEFVLYEPKINARFNNFYVSWPIRNGNKINSCTVIISSNGETFVSTISSGLNTASIMSLGTILNSIDWVVVRVWDVDDPSNTVFFPKIGIIDMDGKGIWSIINGFEGYGNIKLNTGEFQNSNGNPTIHILPKAVNTNVSTLDTLRGLKKAAIRGNDMLITRYQAGKYWALYGGIPGSSVQGHQPAVYNLDGTLATLYDLGVSSLRPKPTATNAISIGTKFYDQTLNTIIYCKKSVGEQEYADWITTYGAQVNHGAEANVTSIKGTSATREAMTMYEDNEGFQYYDTTLHKYVLWNGTAWVNLDGTPLS